MKKIRDFFKKSKVTKRKSIKKVKKTEFIIIPEFSPRTDFVLTDEDAEKIVEIICEEKEKNTEQICFFIAKRIAEEIIITENCSVSVKTEEDGSFWEVKISDCPYD